MGNNLQEAKKIYVTYGGNHWHMQLDGIDEKYRAFHVPEQVEKTWLYELQAELLTQIDNEENVRELSTLINRLAGTVPSKQIQYLMRMLEQIEPKIESVDSFTKVIIAESLQSYMRIYRFRSPGIQNILRPYLINKYSKILVEPIVASDSYFKDSTNGEFLTEEKIRSRIIRDLDELKTL